MLPMSNENQTVGLLFVGAMALVLLGAGCMSTAKPTPTMMGDDTAMEDAVDTMMAGDAMNDDNSMAGGDVMMEEGDSMMEQSSAGTFEAYSKEKLAMAENGTVILAFLADWCPSCRTLKNDITANLEQIPAGITILEVDYDSATALRQTYGITTQHTFVEVDASGTMLQKWTGGNTLTSLVEKVS